MNNLKKRDQYIQEELKPWSDKPDAEDMKRNIKPKFTFAGSEMISMTKAMEIAWEAWKERDTQIAESEGTEFDYKSSRADFDIWWDGKYKTNENILPKPYKKVKCDECGEEVCDNINYKIGHLYNRHNCKPSVGDYKAKRMMKKYFA